MGSRGDARVTTTIECDKKIDRPRKPINLNFKSIQTLATRFFGWFGVLEQTKNFEISLLFNNFSLHDFYLLA